MLRRPQVLYSEYVAIPAATSTKVLLFILLIVQENIRHTGSKPPHRLLGPASSDKIEWF
jgi:hypothetical protein